MCRAGFGNVKSFEKSTLPKTIKNHGIIILIPSKCYLDLTILFNLKTRVNHVASVFGVN